MEDLRRQRDARKRSLEEQLSNLNLVLRHDSRLCSCYINGTTSPEWTASKVAKECATMHWLHNFTDYEERCAVAATQLSRKMWFHSGQNFADYMKRRVYPAIKESILNENAGGPEEWPWTKTATTTSEAQINTPTR